MEAVKSGIILLGLILLSPGTYPMAHAGRAVQQCQEGSKRFNIYLRESLGWGKGVRGRALHVISSFAESKPVLKFHIQKLEVSVKADNVPLLGRDSQQEGQVPPRSHYHYL